MNKKAQQSFSIGDLGGIAITLLVLAIILGVGQLILGSVQDQNTAYATYNVSNPGSWDTAVNATDSGMTGVDTLSGYQGTIALIAVAAVIVGIVLMFFGRGAR